MTAMLLDLADRCEALAKQCEEATSFDEKLNVEVAEMLGWHVRRVTKLGLNGRTPGNWLWFGPASDQWVKGKKKPPALIGSRNCATTVAALRACASLSQSKGDRDDQQ